MQAPTKQTNQEVQGKMENKTTYADLFRALQHAQHELAETLVNLGRLLLINTILVLLTGGLMLYQFIGHVSLVPWITALIVTTAAAAIWIWLSLPEDIAELFEGIDVPELPEK
jgi:hypothetical protein